MLAPETPYPMAGGGALRTASLLHYLARKYETDLIVFREPGAPDPASGLPGGLVRRVTVIDLPANRRDAPARMLRNASRLARRVPPLVDRFAGFGEAVSRALDGRRYELAVVEHFWCAPYCRELAPSCVRTVLDLHNVESLLHERCAATEGGIAGFSTQGFRAGRPQDGTAMAAAVRRTAGRFGGRCRRPAAGGSGFDGPGLSECHTGDTPASPGG